MKSLDILLCFVACVFFASKLSYADSGSSNSTSSSNTTSTSEGESTSEGSSGNATSQSTNGNQTSTSTGANATGTNATGNNTDVDRDNCVKMDGENIEDKPGRVVYCGRSKRVDDCALPERTPGTTKDYSRTCYN